MRSEHGERGEPMVTTDTTFTVAAGAPAGGAAGDTLLRTVSAMRAETRLARSAPLPLILPRP